MPTKKTKRAGRKSTIGPKKKQTSRRNSSTKKHQKDSSRKSFSKRGTTRYKLKQLLKVLSGSRTKKPSKKRVISTGHKPKKHLRASVTKKVKKRGTKPPKGYSRTSPRRPPTSGRKQKKGKGRATRIKTASGFSYSDPREPEDALTTIDETLSDYIDEFSNQFPTLSFSAHSFPPYRDSSVAGEITVAGFQGFTHDDWEQFLHTVGGFEHWPVAHGQGRDGDKEFGSFWFSLDFVFNVPDNRAWRSLEERYERYKGAWHTSTHWRRSKQANNAIVDAALWGKEGKSLPELLEQKDYKYKVESMKLRVVWTPDGYKPNWR